MITEKIEDIITNEPNVKEEEKRKRKLEEKKERKKRQDKPKQRQQGIGFSRLPC